MKLNKIAPSVDPDGHLGINLIIMKKSIYLTFSFLYFMQLFIHNKIILWQFGSSKTLREWPFQRLLETQMDFVRLSVSICYNKIQEICKT